LKEEINNEKGNDPIGNIDMSILCTKDRKRSKILERSEKGEREGIIQLKQSKV
jgi:hypothetical protein